MGCEGGGRKGRVGERGRGRVYEMVQRQGLTQRQ